MTATRKIPNWLIYAGLGLACLAAVGVALAPRLWSRARWVEVVPANEAAAAVGSDAPGPADNGGFAELVAEAIARGSLQLGLTTDDAAALSAPAGRWVAASAHADLGALSEVYRAFGGRYQRFGLDQMREHWRRGPTQIQPKGWASWSDDDLIAHLHRNARPWSAIDLNSVRVVQAPRNSAGLILAGDHRSPDVVVPTLGGLYEVPDLHRALASGARAVRIDFDFRDGAGVTRPCVIWLCEISPGLWCPAGARVGGGRSDEGFPL